MLSGNFLTGLVEGRSLDALGDQAVELVDDIGDHQSGLDDAGPGTLFEAVDRLRVQGVEAVDALQSGLVVGDGLVRRGAFARRQVGEKAVRRVEMVDRADDGCGDDIGLQAAQVGGALPFEHVIADLVGGAEAGAVDPCERREIVLGGLFLGRDIVVAEIVAEPVRVAQVAAKQSRDRVALEAGLIAGVEQRAQLHRRGGAASAGAGVAGVLRRQRQCAGEEHGGQGQARGDEHAALRIECVAWRNTL